MPPPFAFSLKNVERQDNRNLTEAERVAMQQIEDALAVQQAAVAAQAGGTTERAIMAAIVNILANNSAPLLTAVTFLLRSGTKEGHQVVFDQLALETEATFSWSLAESRASEWVDGYAFDLVTGINQTSADRLRGVLKSWIDDGGTMDELADGIRPIFANDAATERIEKIFNVDRAMMIAETEATRAYAQGKITGYMSSGLANIPPVIAPPDDSHVRCRCDVSLEKRNGVWIWIWLTAVDDRVCFPAWTMVQTDEGEVPIQQLEPGQMVETRQGLKRITAVMQRPYSGDMVTVEAGGRKATATGSHLFWVVEQGWLQGRKLIPRHFLETFNQKPIQVRRVFNFIVGDTTNAPATRLKKFILSLVSGLIPMPVHAVNFQGNLAIGQQEIDAVPAQFGLLNVGNTQSVKGVPYSFFRQSLTLKSTVTAKATKLARLITGNNTESLIAVSAVDVMRRATTNFRAMLSRVLVFVSGKFITTPDTNQNNLTGFATFPTANCVSVSNRFGYGKFLTTRLADLCNHFRLPAFLITGTAAKSTALLNLAWGFMGFFAANGAGDHTAVFSPGVIALVGAVVVVGFLYVASWLGKFLAAKLASYWYGHWSCLLIDITKLYHMWSTKPIIVYDIEVEDAHEFYANGMLVHNCSVCGPLHNQSVGFATQEALNASINSR